MRRTPAATPLSCVIVNRPMSPVARVCVPPHNSTLKPGIVTTRTRSPYFSPNSAIAPDAIAAAVSFTSVVTAALRRICSLTSASISRSCDGGDRREVREVEAQPVRRHERPGLLHVRAQHLSQGGVHQVGGRVVAARGIAQTLVDVRRHGVALVEDVGDHRHLVPAGQSGAEPHDTLHACDDGAGLVAKVAGVGDLSARLQVERRAVEQHVP